MSSTDRRPRAHLLRRTRVVVAAAVAALGLAVVGASPAWAHEWTLEQPELTVAEGVEFDGTVACIDAAGAGGTYSSSDFSATIEWGDGTVTAGTIGGGGLNSPCFLYEIQGTHTYAVAGSYRLWVTVNDLTHTGTFSSSRAGTATVTVRDNDLGVSLGAAPNPVRTGTNLTYTAHVTNPEGTANVATDVRATLTLPPQTQFLGLSKSAGSCVAPATRTTGTITCVIGSMQADSVWTLTATVKVVARGGSSVQAVASAQADDPDPFFANNSATVATSVYGRR